MLKSEWELGSESQGRGIYIRLKGYIDKKFSHSFLSIDEAEELAKQIKLLTSALVEKSSGKCIECNEYISNGDIYYEISEDKKIHKYCLGGYAEKNKIDSVLVPIKAKEFKTRDYHYENMISSHK